MKLLNGKSLKIVEISISSEISITSGSKAIMLSANVQIVRCLFTRKRHDVCIVSAILESVRLSREERSRPGTRYNGSRLRTQRKFYMYLCVTLALANLGESQIDVRSRDSNIFARYRCHRNFPREFSTFTVRCSTTMFNDIATSRPDILSNIDDELTFSELSSF